VSLADSQQAVVELIDVSVERAGRKVLQDISLSVTAGQFLGIVGPNGAGKTTLLKVLLGLWPVTSGSVRVFGIQPGADGQDPHAFGYVPQRQSIDPRFPATVADVVMMGRLCCLGPFKRPRADDWKEVARSLDWVGLADREQRPVGQLSGGEQRRVLLAQALCASTRLLVLDEPTAGLDLPAEHEFYALLRRLQEQLGLTVVAVSHDLLALAGQADQLVCINQRMHTHGNPADVVHSHALREAYSCEFNFLAGEFAFHDHATGPEHSHTDNDGAKD